MINPLIPNFQEAADSKPVALDTVYHFNARKFLTEYITRVVEAKELPQHLESHVHKLSTAIPCVSLKYTDFAIGILSTGEVVIGQTSPAKFSEHDPVQGIHRSEGHLLQNSFTTLAVLKKDTDEEQHEANGLSPIVDNVHREQPMIRSTSAVGYMFDLEHYEIDLNFALNLPKNVPLTALSIGLMSNGFVVLETAQAITDQSYQYEFIDLSLTAKTRMFDKVTRARESIARYRNYNQSK